MRSIPLIAALSVAGLVSTVARADDALAAAQRAYGDVDYGKCKDEAQKALQAPGDKAARVDAWRYLGLCAAALGDGEKARDAFKHMIAIDHDARLPEGLSPRFTSAFREAKGAFVTGAPLAFTVEKETLEGGIRSVRFKLTDELDLVQKVGWRGAAGSTGPPIRAAALMELELPAETDVTLTAFDAAGGEVAILLLPAKKKAEVPVAAPAIVAEDAPFPWAVVGGVTAGVIVIGAAGAIAAVLLTPPQAVTLKTDVAFGK